MTEREKIAQIIAEHLCPQGKAHKTLYGAERKCYSRDNFAECEKVGKCVDALIAAGMGDVKEAEHRAEVAERALRDRATYCATYCVMEDMDCFSLTTVAVESRAKELYGGWVRQAEKELEEEGKDEGEN